MTKPLRCALVFLALIAGCRSSSDPGCPNIFATGNILYVSWTNLSGTCGDLDPLEVDTGLFGKDPAQQCADADPLGNPRDQLCTWDLVSECEDDYGSWTFVGQLEYASADPDAFEGVVTFRRYDPAGNIDCQGSYGVRYTDN